MNFQHNNKKGFTILYAMLVSSLLLSIGLGIYGILIKDLILSSAASNSQIAIFAADSGLECALYWDLKGPSSGPTVGQSIFATSSDSIAYTGIGSQPPAVCAYVPNIMPPTSVSTTPTSAVTIITIYLNHIAGGNTADTTGSCAIVSITKNNVSSLITTTVDSRGYNTCTASNPRRVERGLEIGY